MSDPIPDEFKDLAPMDKAPIAPAHAIGAIALSLALKYHNISTVQDRNLRELDLDMVFETAIKMEQHLLTTSDRIAKLIVDAIAEEGDEK